MNVVQWILCYPPTSSECKMTEDAFASFSTTYVLLIGPAMNVHGRQRLTTSRRDRGVQTFFDPHIHRRSLIPTYKCLGISMLGPTRGTSIKSNVNNLFFRMQAPIRQGGSVLCTSQYLSLIANQTTSSTSLHYQARSTETESNRKQRT